MVKNGGDNIIFVILGPPEKSSGKGIADKGKGKAVAGNSSSGAKRKRDDGNEHSGGCSRRRNDPGVLRFFDDAADEADGSDESDFGNGRFWGLFGGDGQWSFLS
ncbi:hypothetical protein TIFTF001_022042 [Ficus carica]|uniref:Uncharacterized protein n=1 Tax=Ficus carica TaxID=3494 RepID=A0AA88ALE9_FICCA|nr:hypothetical protein TIFTF001_022042 [Ficus carica]